MAATLLRGRDIAERISAKLKSDIESISLSKRIIPQLALIRLSSSSDSDVYAKSIHRVMDKIGIKVKDYSDIYPKVTKHDEVVQEINKIADSKENSALLLLSPAPKGLSHAEIASSIPPQKDAEGSSGAFAGKETEIYPPTALSVLELIKSTGIKIEGKDAVIIGRSKIVGQPSAKLLMDSHATITICHTRTLGLDKHIERADIVVAAAGKPNLIRGSWIKKGAIVIDAAMNVVDGKLVGDVEFESAKENASFITPVPQGVGPLTNFMLAQNVIKLFNKHGHGITV